MQLRDYQEEAYSRCLTAVRKRQSPLVVIGTGGGKTPVLASLAASGVAAGKRVIVIAPLTKLIPQHVKTLMACGLDRKQIGVLQGNNSDSLEHLAQASVVVAMAQSLNGKRGRDFLKQNQFGICLQDEKHLVWLDKAAELVGAPINISFTATPLRDGNQETLDDYEWIEPISTVELVQRQQLTRFQHYLYRQTVEIKTTNSDYTPDEQRAILQNITPEFVLKEWLFARPSADYTLGFCRSIKQAKEYATYFTRMGYPSEAICEETLEKDRFLKDGTLLRGSHSIESDFRAGKLKAIFSVTKLATGYDEPLAKCLLILRPTKSLALWFQMFGRGLRPIPGLLVQPIAQILDFGGCGMRLPLPTEIDSFKSYLESQVKVSKQAGTITKEKIESQPTLPVFRDLSGGAMVPRQDPRLITDDVELIRELRHQAFWIYCCSPVFVWKKFCEVRQCEPAMNTFKGLGQVLEGSIFKVPTVESFLAYQQYLSIYQRERSQPRKWMTEEVQKEFGSQGLVWLRQCSVVSR